MAGNLGSAVIEFSADTAKFVGDVGKASATFNRSMATMEAGIANLRNAFVTLAAAGGVGMMVKSAIDAGDQLNKLSQKIGISVESLSELKLGAELADVDLDGLTTGLKKFNVALAAAKDDTSKQAEIFKQLGVDITRGPQVALRQFADGIAQLADGETKTAIATEFLGRAGINMIPWLNAGAAGMDKAAASARALGLTISADFAAKAEQFNDNLKLLGKRSEALGIAIASQVVPGLASFTGELVKAAEKGELLSGVLREIIKLDLALFSKLPGPLGAMAGAAAERAFRERPEGNAYGGAVSGRIRRPAEIQGPPAPNPEAVACAVSGGKWVNGRCERKERVAAERDDAEQIARLQLAAEEEFQKAVTEGWTLTGEARNREIERDRQTRERNMQAWFDMIDRENEAAIEQTRLYLEALNAGAQKTDSVMAKLGFTMTSAFEDASLAALGLTDRMANARDVARGLLADIARVLMRKNISDPIANAIGGINTANWFNWGGGSASVEERSLADALSVPEYAVGTPFVPRTGLALLHQGEAVIPAVENAQRGGDTYYIDASGADAARIAQLERMVQALHGSVERRAVNAVAEQRLRGGAFASVFR